MTSAVNGKIYIFGGAYSSGVNDKTYEYDPAQNTWAEKTPMDIPLVAPNGGTIDGKAYISGGGSGVGTIESSVLEYTPGKDN